MRSNRGHFIYFYNINRDTPNYFKAFVIKLQVVNLYSRYVCTEK